MNCDLDILNIDRLIKEKLIKQIENVVDIECRRNHIESIINDKNTSDQLKKGLSEYLNELNLKIHDYNNNISLNLYISSTADCIERYKKMLEQPIKVNFIGKQMPSNRSEKRKIIDEYLMLAKPYSDFELNNYYEADKKEKKITCKDCGNKKDFEVVESNIYVCNNCSAEQVVIKHVSSYKDIDRINMTSKYLYDRKIHFRDCINQYQGKQNSTISQKVYDDLENQFESHHLLIGDKNTEKEVRFSNITKEHVAMFLKELDYTKHYENIHLIHYTLTGKKPDDISHLEAKLLDDFDILVDLYDRLFKNNIDRKNFINTQYVLFQLLSRHKHPCKPEDFTILKTVERKSFHDQVCKQLFEYLGWNMVVTTF